jgi:hypothetical protein
MRKLNVLTPVIGRLRTSYVASPPSTTNILKALESYGLSPDVRRQVQHELRLRLLFQLACSSPIIVGYIYVLHRLQIPLDEHRMSELTAYIYVLAAGVYGGVFFALFWWRAKRSGFGEQREALSLTLDCARQLRTCRDLLVKPDEDGDPPIPVPIVYKVVATQRTARDRVPLYSWRLVGALSVLTGRSRRERSREPIANVGKWLCWACDDLNDRHRLEQALAICADTLAHIVSARPWVAPSLPWPPRAARMDRPKRQELLRSSMSGLRTALILLLPLATAIVGFATKII